MSIPTKLALALLVIFVAAIFLVIHFRKPDVPGYGQPAEIINPITRQRYKTTWDRVLENPSARQDPSTNGGWMAPVPGTNPPIMGYVVNAGQHHPSEDVPVPLPVPTQP